MKAKSTFSIWFVGGTQWVVSGILTLLCVNSPAAPRNVPNEILVQYKANSSEQQRADARAQAQLEHREEVLTARMKADGKAGFVRAVTHMPVDKAIELLLKHPAVEFAEPNWIYTHQAVANDAYYSQGYLWGMYGSNTTPRNAYGSAASTAWSSGAIGSKTVYVGIIDEGIQVTHPDLRDNAWTNSYDPPDGIDNDGNGYVDDVNGWNFYANNNAVNDPGDSHGSHVTGTIGAKGGNGIGVAGVNWNVTFISGKFLGPDGGTTADAVRAIDYFTDLKLRHHLNIVALNNSWGGGGYSQALKDAILRAAKADILFVVAAGNGDAAGNGLNNDVTADYPCDYDTTKGTSTESAASFDAVISVAAIDANGARATFSNYGAKTVDLGAPGVSILSTVPTDSYGTMSGTSMATPHVTGAVALYASTHPTDTASAIKAALLKSVTPTPSLAGLTVTGGRLNIPALLAIPPASQANLTDSDNDGIPDIYETATGNFLSETNTGTSPTNPDTDGDGVKDGDELIAGTDPCSKADVLHVESVRPVNGGVAVRFPAKTGRVYQLLYCDSLGGSTNAFTPVSGATNITVTASGSIEVTDTSAGSHAARFYRIVVRKP